VVGCGCKEFLSKNLDDSSDSPTTLGGGNATRSQCNRFSKRRVPRNALIVVSTRSLDDTGSSGKGVMIAVQFNRGVIGTHAQRRQHTREKSDGASQVWTVGGERIDIQDHIFEFIHDINAFNTRQSCESSHHSLDGCPLDCLRMLNCERHD
jgi:hypothetical protein